MEERDLRYRLEWPAQVFLWIRRALIPIEFHSDALGIKLERAKDFCSVERLFVLHSALLACRIGCFIDFSLLSDIISDEIATIPLAELTEATRGSSDERIIGRGGFGIVYRERWSKCRSEHILNFYGFSIDRLDKACLVHESMPNGSLDDRLRRKVKPPVHSDSRRAL